MYRYSHGTSALDAFHARIIYAVVNVRCEPRHSSKFKPAIIKRKKISKAAKFLTSDDKIRQANHIPPWTTFWLRMQMMGPV